MKKFIIAFSLACASAYVFGRPELSKTPWFSASAETGSDVRTEDSTWSPSAPQIADGKYAISTDITSPIKFITNSKSPAGDFAETTFNLVTAIVPAAGRVALTGTDKTVAFAVSEDGSGNTAYYAWLGAGTGFGWKKLAGATPKLDGEAYTLVVTFDTYGQNRVQFKVGDSLLYKADDSTHSTWIAYDGTQLPGTQFAINFAGDGAVASFEGKQVNITAEIVDESNGTIRIPKADVLKFNIPTGTDKETYFEAKAAMHSEFTGFKSDISVAAAYVLGLLDTTGSSVAVVDGGELRPCANAEANNSDGIVVNLNVVPKQEADTQTMVSFELYKGDAKVNAEFTTQGGKPSCVIPKTALDSSSLSFKVKAKITPKASAQ